MLHDIDEYIAKIKVVTRSAYESTFCMLFISLLPYVYNRYIKKNNFWLLQNLVLDYYCYNSLLRYDHFEST